MPQLPVARGSVPPSGWQSKPDIKYYQNQVSSALNSLYRLYTSNKCDKCDGNCNNYRCWGCGGCAFPSLQKHEEISSWHPQTSDADKRMYNRVKDALFRQHVAYYNTPAAAPAYDTLTSRSNVTQPVKDSKKSLWTNPLNHKSTMWSFPGPF